MDALPELREARSAWRHARALGDAEARLRAMHTYITTRFRVACRGPGGDGPRSVAWQRRLHGIEEILDTTATAAQHVAWNQSPARIENDERRLPPFVVASCERVPLLDENHPFYKLFEAKIP